MGKKALRVGELVVALDSRRAPAIYGVPLKDLVGGFRFGMFMGGNHVVHDELAGDDKTFIFVIDSQTLRFGWCWANLVRRAKEEGDLR